jgi:hypothetical protein
MVAKVIWDTIMYWSLPGLLFFHQTFPRLNDYPRAFESLFKGWKIHSRVQQFFREWHALDDKAVAGTFADPYTLLPFIVDLHEGMAAGLPDDKLDEQVMSNVAQLEYVAGQLVATVIDTLEADPAPAAVEQIGKWKADALLGPALATYHRQEHPVSIDKAWVTLGLTGNPDRATHG